MQSLVYLAFCTARGKLRLYTLVDSEGPRLNLFFVRQILCADANFSATPHACTRHYYAQYAQGRSVGHAYRCADMIAWLPTYALQSSTDITARGLWAVQWGGALN